MKKDILKRVLCLACCLSLTLGMFAYRPAKAQAVVIDATAALGAAATVCVVDYSTAALLVSGMKTGAVTSSVIGAMDTYAAATGAAASGTALASTIGAGTVITAAGSLVLGAAATIALIKFVEWLREDKGIEAGGDPVSLGGVGTGYFDYNGYVFPALPDDWDSYTYPYCFIGRPLLASNLTAFMASTHPLHIRGTSAVAVAVDERVDLVWWTLDGSGTSSSWSSPSYKTYTDGGNRYLTDYIHSHYYIWGNQTLYSNTSDTVLETYEPVPLYVDGTDFVLQPNEEFQELPDAIPEGQTMVISPGIADLPQDDPQAAADAIMQPIIDGAVNPSVTIEADPTVTPDPDPNPDPDGSTGADPDTGTETDPDTTTSWLSRILESIKALPQQIAEAVGNIISSIFAPDAELVNEITGTFSEKFGFVETLKTIGDDLFGMTPSSEPPVVWIHLEDAEGKYYYGGTVKALDMSWFQRYKEDVDRILGGFLWVAYLWLLFRRLPDILGGAGLVIADSQYIGDGMYVDGSTGEITGRFMYRRSKRL